MNARAVQLQVLIRFVKVKSKLQLFTIQQADYFSQSWSNQPSQSFLKAIVTISTFLFFFLSQPHEESIHQFFEFILKNGPFNVVVDGLNVVLHNIRQGLMGKERYDPGFHRVSFEFWLLKCLWCLCLLRQWF